MNKYGNPRADAAVMHSQFRQCVARWNSSLKKIAAEYLFLVPYGDGNPFRFSCYFLATIKVIFEFVRLGTDRSIQVRYGIFIPLFLILMSDLQDARSMEYRLLLRVGRWCVISAIKVDVRLSNPISSIPISTIFCNEIFE
jgi:hypothetical protein